MSEGPRGLGLSRACAAGLTGAGGGCRQAIDYIFLLSGEAFAGPNYLRYLSESVQSLEWKAFAFLQQQDQSRRAASQPQEDEQLSPRRKRLRDSEQQDKAMQWAAQVAARVGPSATGLTDLYGKANNPTGEVMGPGTGTSLVAAHSG